jgi:hypothetical protein
MFLMASSFFTTSPTYSHTKVPRGIGSAALTAQPCSKWNHYNMICATCYIVIAKVCEQGWGKPNCGYKYLTLFSVLKISILISSPRCNTLFGHDASQAHTELHSYIGYPSCIFFLNKHASTTTEMKIMLEDGCNFLSKKTRAAPNLWGISTNNVQDSYPAWPDSLPSIKSF